MPGILLSVLLPRVEDPIPETIGVSAIFSAAGAGGVLALAAGSMLGLPEGQQDALARRGVNLGFAGGVLFYVVALVGQVL
jgi:hypothetical protein